MVKFLVRSIVTTGLHYVRQHRQAPLHRRDDHRAVLTVLIARAYQWSYTFFAIGRPVILCDIRDPSVLALPAKLLILIDIIVRRVRVTLVQDHVGLLCYPTGT